MCLFEITIAKLPVDGKVSKMQVEVHGVPWNQIGPDGPDAKTAEFTDKLASFQVAEYTSYLLKYMSPTYTHNIVKTSLVYWHYFIAFMPPQIRSARRIKSVGWNASVRSRKWRTMRERCQRAKQKKRLWKRSM